MAWALGEKRIGVERTLEFRDSPRSLVARVLMAHEISTWPSHLLDQVILKYLRRLQDAGIPIEDCIN